MKYIKMQGAGNDYVFFNCIEKIKDFDHTTKKLKNV